MNFWQFLQQNWPELLTLTREHIVLVVVSIAIAVVIGLPTGILLTRYQKLRTPVLGIANIMQTVPSLALFSFDSTSLHRWYRCTYCTSSPGPIFTPAHYSQYSHRNSWCRTQRKRAAVAME